MNGIRSSGDNTHNGLDIPALSSKVAKPSKPTNTEPHPNHKWFALLLEMHVIAITATETARGKRNTKE